jgi:hypothetical protein
MVHTRGGAADAGHDAGGVAFPLQVMSGGLIDLGESPSNLEKHLMLKIQRNSIRRT